MEAAVRTAHYLLTGKELTRLTLKDLRGLEGVKQATVRMGDADISVMAVSGLGNARRVLKEIQDGRLQASFVEVMACPGGCIAGGGQPLLAEKEDVAARMKALYRIDRDASVRLSHENAAVQRLYERFLGKPLGERSHQLLHTTYARRDVLR